MKEREKKRSYRKIIKISHKQWERERKRQIQSGRASTDSRVPSEVFHERGVFRHLLNILPVLIYKQQWGAACVRLTACWHTTTELSDHRTALILSLCQTSQASILHLNYCAILLQRVSRPYTGRSKPLFKPNTGNMSIGTSHLLIRWP